MNYASDYHKGICALEDLYALGDTSLTPVVNRAYYHFSNLASVDRTACLDELPMVQSFLIGALRNMFCDYLSFNAGYLKVDFQLDKIFFTLPLWNRLLEVLPATLAIVNSFEFTDRVSVKSNSQGLIISGKVKLGENVESLRPDIYRNFRTIIKNQGLLTFSLVEDEMTFYLNIATDNQEVYAIDLRDDYAGLILGLPNSFANYIVTQRFSGAHDVLEITDHLELVCSAQIPDQIDPQRGIVHFSFLFRPVSIIIPKKGKLLPIETLRPGEGTGSGRTIEKSGKSGFYYLDFFSIMSK